MLLIVKEMVVLRERKKEIFAAKENKTALICILLDWTSTQLDNQKAIYHIREII